MKVHVESPEPALRDGVLAKLRQAGIAAVGEPVLAEVTVAVADTVGRAIGSCPAVYRTSDYRLLVLAELFAPAEVRHALRIGVRAMLKTTSDAKQIAAAVYATSLGEDRMPAEVLLELLHGVGGTPARNPSPLTPRQTAVLTLMADGHPNVAIAEALSCSEHTIKNVIYDLMMRLQVRNRSHAVATAVRAGFI